MFERSLCLLFPAQFHGVPSPPLSLSQGSCLSAGLSLRVACVLSSVLHSLGTLWNPPILSFAAAHQPIQQSSYPGLADKGIPFRH